MGINWAEHTSNPEARVFIDAAKRKCRECARNWRLVTGEYVHATSKVACTAVDERTKLREIAAKARTNQ